MVAAVLLLVVLLSLGPLASKIPAAVLAGILVTVGIGVMDYKGLRHIRQLPRAEVGVMLLVLVLTVFVGLIQAVVIGLMLSCVLFMKNIADVVSHRTKFAPLKEFSRELPWEDEGDLIRQIGHQVFIKHLDGPLFFGFAFRFQEMVAALPDVQVVAIRMDKVPYVDQSGLYAMEDAILNLTARNIDVVFVDVHGQPLAMFERFDLIPDLVPRERCFEGFNAFSKWLTSHLGAKPTVH